MSLKRLRLLGLPCVEAAGAQSPLGAGRPLQLLARLAVDGHWHRRDDLARLFWPDRPDKVARSNLRNLLCKVPAAAPWAGLESTEQALRLRVPSDLQELDAAFARADWEAVLQLAAPELLQGFEQEAPEPFLQWLLAERAARLAQWKRAVQALLAAAAPLERRQSLAQEWARRCPDDEDAVQARMALAHERGQPGAAARLYREFEAWLHQEYGVRPSRQLERLALEPPAPRTAAGAPLAAAAAAAPQAPLFGRRVELARLEALLADDSLRLISLTGPGGVGKSTLMAALRARCRDAGHAELRWIDASMARDAAAVVVALGVALGVDRLQGEQAVRDLARAVGERPCLLLLDGAEQPGLAGPLAQLLAACPRLRLLVAARTRLHLDPELVVPIEGFPLPDAEEADAQVLATNDAVRYFAGVMRQAGREPDLAREAAAIAALARAVEGLPLALRLLAQLTHLFPLPQLLDSVRRHVAGGAGADTPALAELMPALVASFERSWAALMPAQQDALARLAVFPASFDIAAARAVGRTGLPVITSLVDASLVRSDGSGRLSLHAAIRACVLAAQPPSAATEADYLEHYRRRLAALAETARTRSMRPMREFLRLETPNVESVWQRALDAGAHAVLLSVAESLWFHADGITGPTDWQHDFAIAHRRLRGAAEVPPALQALLAAGAARSAYFQGHLEQATEGAREALRLASRVRHRDALRFALDTLMRVAAVQRRLPEAQALSARAAQVDESLREDGLLAGIVLKQQQILAFLRGQVALDLGVAERLEALYERFEDDDALVRVMLAKAFARSTTGDLAAAVQAMERAAAVAADRGANPALQAIALCDAAFWRLESGGIAEARANVDRANAISFEHPQARFLRLKTRLANAALAVAQGDPAAAVAPLTEVLEAMGRREELPLAEPALLVAARCFVALRERDTALELLRAIGPQVWEMRTYEAARALRRELGEAEAASPPEAAAAAAEAPTVAAQAARRLPAALERWRAGGGSASEALVKRRP